MIASKNQNKIRNFLSETRGVEVADMFMLDGLCGLTSFNNVQEHLLSIVPKSESKNEWVLENDSFQKTVSRNSLSKISAKNGFWMMSERCSSRGYVTRKKYGAIFVRWTGIGVVSIVFHGRMLRKREKIPCECGSERWVGNSSRFFSVFCGFEDLTNDHSSSSPLY